MPPSIHHLNHWKRPISEPLSYQSLQLQLICLILILWPLRWYNQWLWLHIIQYRQTCWWLWKIFIHHAMLHLCTVLLLLILYVPSWIRLWLLIPRKSRKYLRRRRREGKRVGIWILKTIIMLRKDISSYMWKGITSIATAAGIRNKSKWEVPLILKTSWNIRIARSTVRKHGSVNIVILLILRNQKRRVRMCGRWSQNEIQWNRSHYYQCFIDKRKKNKQETVTEVMTLI